MDKKITRMEYRDAAMPANEHGARTYGEWCRKDAERMRDKGAEVFVYEEWRVLGPEGFVQVPENTDGAVAWCRIERC